MNKLYEEIKSKAQSAFKSLAKECVQFDDARMLLGAASASTSLTRSKTSKTIDTDWVDKIEAALPVLDMIIRNPSVAIEDVDEVFNKTIRPMDIVNILLVVIMGAIVVYYIVRLIRSRKAVRSDNDE